MNILMINKFYFEKGGAERYFFALKKLLEKNKNKVIPFAMHHGKNLKSAYSKYFVSEITTQPSFNIWQDFRTTFRFFWSFEAQRKIQKLIDTEKIDLAHIHNIYHQISPSILKTLKKNNIPIVMTVHDYALISANYNLYKPNTKFVQSIISNLVFFYHHKILKIYKKNIDMFICPSEFVKNKLISAGYDKNKIKIIPHFITNQQDNKITSKQANKYILYFGRLSKEKGIDVLIQTAKELPEVNFVLAGTGLDKKNYELIVTSYQLQNIKFIGHKSQSELQQLIKNAELIVMPSLAPETFGLSALEALALNKIVIASNIGALPEILPKEFLVKPGDVKALIEKIRALVPHLLERSGKQVRGLTDKEKYDKIIADINNSKFWQKYHEKEHYQSISKIYQQLIKS